ncbi:hypothetical protein IT157_09990, partial [bacterium]|nr:hypothetical protein [bacterium]
MRSKTLFVWLAAAMAMLVTLFMPQTASAQIDVSAIIDVECIEDPNALVPPNGIIDELGDELRIHVKAAYMTAFCDSIDVGLETLPDLGALNPALYPSIIMDCPAGITTPLYEMNVTITPHMGLGGPTANPFDSCLVDAELQFHPDGVVASAGDPLDFGVTWFGWANTPPQGFQQSFCADAGFQMQAPCSINSGCAFIRYIEAGGIAFDGVVAIGDSIWLDSLMAASIDTGAVGDTLFWDASAVICNPFAAAVFAYDTLVVSVCEMENGMGCGDTLFLYYAIFDESGDPDDFDYPGDIVDTFVCIRPVDNTPPSLDQACVDSCRIINGNYMDNDTIAGCNDTLVVYLSTIQNGFPTRTNSSWNCDGDSVFWDQSFNVQDCDTGSRNFDVAYLALDFEDFVMPGDTFPINSPLHNLLSDTALWVSERHFVGSGGDPGAINNLISLKIPISCCGDTSLWDSLEYCILEALENLDTIYAYSIDDAGNLSNPVAWGDTAGTLVGCDICLDNQHPQLPGSNVYWSWDGEDNYCNQRFSPYDSALATVYTNLSPDSIRWYLDAVDSVYDTTNLVHNLTKVYLIGFDVRVIPDDNPDTPTGAVITRLDYFHPYAVPTGSDSWEWRSPYVPGIDSSACFTWYGKDGVDSLDDDLDILNIYCPWGMLVGITEARYMDRGGCNAVYGSDHDGATSITDGYTQLNCLYSVLDTCRPTTELAFDLNDWYHDPLPFGPDYGSVNDPYLWVDGNETPLLAFRAHRYYTQGLLDTCLAEDLCYRIKVDTVYIQGTWSYSADSFYVGNPFSCGSAAPVCYPIDFLFNDVFSDTLNYYWNMEDPDCDPLPDGLYCLSLELIDNAGNVYNEDTVCIWKNGLGPAIDSVAVVNDALNCNLNFFVGESLCVWIATDTSATEVMFDFSCIYNMSLVQPDSDTMIVTEPYATSGALDYWYACVMVQDSMIDTADVSRNSYRINPVEGDCRDADDYYNLGVTAYDIDGNFTEAEYTDGNCVIAILGPSRCPRIVGPIEFWYYYPDTVYAGIDYTDSIDALFDDFDVFGPMPDWNAFSPGSVDSSGAYDSEDNPAHDEIHDSIFVRILLDTLSITQPDNFGVPWDDDVYHDTLYVEFHNPSNTRSRIVAKPLFKTLCEDLDGSLGCEDPDSNTIYDGRLENADPDAFIDTDALMEFSYMWNGTWFITAGMDSLMLVPIKGQDTILVNAWTVDGDSIVDSISVDEIYYFTCPQVSAELDVDNDNPEFLEWTGIATGVRDEDTHSTATVQNNEWDGDCGFRFAEGDTFSITVHASEQVHYDPAAYPNSDGSEYGAAEGLWQITGNWQISLVDPATQYLIPNGSAPGDYIAVELVTVTPESIDVDEWEYTLIGRIYAMPEDTFIYNSCFVIRGAWDQGGNPGRYNTPPFSDAYEEDSFEDTTFCVDLIPCDVFAAGCPDVYGPDMIHGWIAPEDTNIVVCATLIETCELTDCDPGVHADSMRVVEGDFQRITDDPNPWIIPDSVGAWFIYNDGVNDLGWARMYYWTLRADSSDLATIWCDGTFLDFSIHAVSWEGVNVTQTFDNCVQVDVNEPRWAECQVARDAEGGTIVLDSTGAVIWACESDDCIQPDQEITLVGNLRDYLVDCMGYGTGVDTSEIYADLSSLLNIHDGSADSVRPDSIAVLIGGGGGTYAYAGPPVAITDYDTSFASIDVPITGTVSGITVTITDIHHTFTGDLDIFLRSPGGTMVELSTDNDGGNNYINTV